MYKLEIYKEGRVSRTLIYIKEEKLELTQKIEYLKVNDIPHRLWDEVKSC